MNKIIGCVGSGGNLQPGIYSFILNPVLLQYIGRGGNTSSFIAQGSNVALALSSQWGVVNNSVTFAWLISGRKVNIAKVVLHLRLARAG